MENEQDNNKEQELSLEKQLLTANSEASELLIKLKANLEEFSSLVENIVANKNKFDETLTDIDTKEKSFNQNIENQLADYKNKFTDLETELENIKTSYADNFKILNTQYTEIIDKYENDVEAKLEVIREKISNTTDLLNNKQNEFNDFIADNKTNYEKQYEDLKTLVSQYKSSTTESLTSIKARLDEATENSEKIKQIESQAKVFKDNLDGYIQNMTSKTEEIEVKTQQYKSETDNIINTNKALTEEIKEQLQKATGVSLFHMFQQRKMALEKNQGWWLGGVIASIIALVCFSWWIISSLQSVPQNGNIDWFKDAIFKFTLSTPVIYLLYFLTDRYTKLRRLIEEYAFKSAISLALTPYFDLVKGLDDETQEKDKDFLIAVIGNIFKTPTDKVFRTKEGQFDLDFSSYYKNIANVFIPSNSNDINENQNK